MKMSRRDVVSTLGAIVAGAFGGKCKAQVIDEEPFMLIIDCPDHLTDEEVRHNQEAWRLTVDRFPQLEKIPVIFTSGGASIRAIRDYGSYSGETSIKGTCEPGCSCEANKRD